MFERDWLPEKVGTSIVAQAPSAFARVELARAEAYALVQARWLDRDRITVELGAARFTFDVRTALDASGRVHPLIAPSDQGEPTGSP